MYKTLMFLSLLLAVCSACEDPTVVDPTSDCDALAIISSTDYLDAPIDQVTINSAVINGNCLQFNFSASGCSGDDWELTLIDSDAIMESSPPQRNVRLSLTNPELCEAYITKEMSFDISNLQVDGNAVYLNITNNDVQVLYEY